ncbi:hypothetical protein GQ600_9972 [Phytophthora cactorum]|nr:hypothetical protein GQ600_9972 [Phytophthora cactorum]
MFTLDGASNETLGLGPKAVVRNTSKELKNQTMKRLIVTDSFYATVSLSLKLLDIGLCHVGTTRMDVSNPVHKQKTPKKIPRGTYRIAQARGIHS